MANNLERVLRLMAEKNASDVYMSANTPILIKIHGQILQLSDQMLTTNQTRQLLGELLAPQQMEELEETGELNVGISIPRVGSFRLSAFKQRGSIAAVFRCIPYQIPSLDSLGVPPLMSQIVTDKRGLILMVGATGTGKSTTLASMIEWRNQQMSGHILTIEDPIEFSHPNLKSIINQREIGVDTHNYRAALRSSLREAPDVILIGEIRDRETMEAALELCNTGHLCLSTMHANNANQAMERVVNLFPQDLHKQLFLDLSLNIRAVISQRLVQGVDGYRVAAIEIMINTPHIADLILKGLIGGVKEAMEGSGAKGMQTFDMALYNLYKEERIDLEEALNNADSRTNLEARINFG